MPKLITRQEIINKHGYPGWIKGDKLSLYISNYAATAHYLADRIGRKNKTICELCCGVGLTLSELAKRFEKTIGIDNDKKVIGYCKQNITSFKVSDKTEIISGDISDPELLKKIKSDIVIYDIPYWNIGLTENTGLEKKNPKLKEIVNNIKKLITKDIIICAPPHYTYKNAKKDFGKCECESIFIGSKHDRNYIYLGNLIKKQGTTKTFL